MKVKAYDIDIVLHILDCIGPEFQKELEKASMEETLGDFLETMEGYGYWDPFKWCILNPEAFKAVLKSAYRD